MVGKEDPVMPGEWYYLEQSEGLRVGNCSAMKGCSTQGSIPNVQSLHGGILEQDRLPAP